MNFSEKKKRRVDKCNLSEESVEKVYDIDSDSISVSASASFSVSANSSGNTTMNKPDLKAEEKNQHEEATKNKTGDTYDETKKVNSKPVSYNRYYVPKHCKGCCYRRNMYFGLTGCHYMLDTGEKRNCSPEKCDKKRLDPDYRPAVF